MTQNKKRMSRRKEKITLRRDVKTTGASGLITLPKFLVGTEVEITFERNLTEEEIKRIQLNQIHAELRKIREKKRK